MIEYVATFFSHYGAIKFRRECEKLGMQAKIMPVPRDLSSSCGTCVRFTGGEQIPDADEEVEQIVRVTSAGYVCIYHVEE